MAKKLLIPLLFLLLFSVSHAASPVVSVVDPNGGESIQIPSSYDINVSASDADDANFLAVSLYYSSTPGTMQNVIVYDWNIANVANCPNFETSSVSFTCVYDWNISQDLNIHVEDAEDNWGNWSQLLGDTDADGVTEVTVKHQGTSSLELAIDKAGTADWAAWRDGNISWNLTPLTKTRTGTPTDGNLSLWIASDVSQLAATNPFKLTLYSGGVSNYYAFESPTKTVLGLTADNTFVQWDINLAAPTSSAGTMNWADINVVDFNVREVAANNTDFMVYVDYVRAYALAGTVTEGTYYIDANISDNTTTVLDSSDDYFTLGGTTVTVKVPKDEDNLALITNYRVQVFGILGQDLNNLSADQSVYITAGDQYRFVISDVNNEYYARTYTINTNSDYTLQPYLVDKNQAIIVDFTALERTERVTIPDVNIVARKAIPGVGTETVENKFTDLSGVATFSFIENDDYNILVYYQGTLEFSGQFRPTQNDYYILLDLTVLSDIDTNGAVVWITWPTPYTLTVGDANYSWEGDINSQNTVITNIDVNISNAGNVIRTYGLGPGDGISPNYHFTLDANLNGLNEAWPVVIDINVAFLHGSIYSTRNYLLPLTDHNIMSDLGLLADQTLGGDADTLRFIAIFFTVFVAAGVSIFLKDPSALFIIVAVVLGFFVYLGWVEVHFFGLAVLIGIAVFVYTRRNF